MKKYGMLVGGILLLVLSVRSKAFAERDWRFGAAIDVYRDADIADNVESKVDRFHAQLAALSIQSNKSVDAGMGFGVRGGGYYDLSSNLAIGASLGFVRGPDVDVAFEDLDPSANGSIRQDFRVRYFRLLAELIASAPISRHIAFELGAGAGLARAEATMGLRGQGFYFATDHTISNHELGVTWELSPAVRFKSDQTDTIVGLRYTVFPDIGLESDFFNDPFVDVVGEEYRLEWKSVGAFISFLF